jgi:uncharacterized membrane protein
VAEDSGLLVSRIAGKTEAARILPSTAPEFITALSHYYRGELSRMMSWRDRLDRTSNWAVTLVAGMFSLALSTPTAHHSVLLFGMVLLSLLLMVEARRYRFFDVYRSRVRLLERNYYGQMFAPQPDVQVSAQWLKTLGEDLRRPRFLLPLQLAMARRLRRTYIWLYLLLLVAWVVKTTVDTKDLEDGRVIFVHSASNLVSNAAIGFVPGWAVLAALGVLYAALAYLMATRHALPNELAIGEVHV